MRNVRELLEQTREPEPSDERFVQEVMLKVHRSATARPRKPRRTVLIAVAATALLSGGTVAALVGTQQSPEQERPTVVPPQPTQPVVSAPIPSPHQEVPSETIEPEPADEAVPDLPLVSVVLDGTSGVRLATRIEGSLWPADRAQHVTLSLENTGERVVMIHMLDRCALQAMVYTPGSAQAADTRCAFDPPPSIFALGPHEQRSVRVEVSLSAPGSWRIAGSCRCSFVPLSEGAVEDALPGRLGNAMPSRAMAPESLVSPALEIEAS